jgi:Family of unknown function (DUF5946)
MIDDDAYHELTAYTLARNDVAFIHQHVVDTYAVQSATPADKPIRLAQALVGLYLHVEHGFTGRQVQRVHQLLANQRPTWPAFMLPDGRGAMTVRDVVDVPPGEGRDEAIERWARSTWAACGDLRDRVAALLTSHAITAPDEP